MKNKYFKVITRIKLDYGKSLFISITEDELEKAYFIYLTERRGVLGGKPISGRDIITIAEDWNKAMNWNEEYEIQAIDRNAIRDDGVERLYKGVLENYSKRVAYLIEKNQTHLIGRNVEIPELDRPQSGGMIEGSKKLSDDMRIPE